MLTPGERSSPKHANALPTGRTITDFVRGGPGFVAAVCVRDHWEEMEQEERDWCVNMLIGEIERDCDSDDMFVQASRSGLDPLDRQPTYCPRSWVKVHLMRLMNE